MTVEERNGKSAIGKGAARAGYLFRRFDSEDIGGVPQPLLNDTDGWNICYGDCHHRNRFAFMAFPYSRSEGRFVFIVSGDTTIWKYELPDSYSATCRPLDAQNESASTVRGTGKPGIDDAKIFPLSPGSLGFSKWD